MTRQIAFRVSSFEFLSSAVIGHSSFHCAIVTTARTITLSEHMAKVRTVATFQSSAFNATEQRDYFLHDSAYGDDLAEWLMDELRARDIQTDLEPVQDESGWHFAFRKGDSNYRFTISRRLATSGRSATWVGSLEQSAGRLRKFLRSKSAVAPEAALAIHSVLNSALLIHNLKWHYHRDFTHGQEDLGQPEPCAK